METKKMAEIYGKIANKVNDIIPDEWGKVWLYGEVLVDIIQELNLEYKENNESVWTNLTFLLDNTGKFNIKYNYDDILNSDFTAGERQIIWEYEVLGIEPEAEQYKEMLNKYLELKNNS